MRLSVSLDGARPVRLWTRALSVANNRYAEGFGLVMSRPRLDAGHLTLYVARRYGLWWWVKLIVGMFLGTWRGSRLPEKCSSRDDIQNGHPQQGVGKTKTYGCYYSNARLLYTATLVKKP